jgi:hypothetical protein
MLYALIRDGLKKDVTSSEGKLVAELCIKYLVGTITAHEFQREIKRVDLTQSDYSGQRFRLKLQDKAYFICNMKYAALNMALKPNNVELLRTLVDKFKLTRNDVVLLKHLFARQTFRRELRASKRVAEIDPKRISYLDMRRTMQEFASFQKPVMDHIIRKTHKKLTFIVNSENSEYRDFHSEIMSKALKVYYHMVPTTKTGAHVLNYLRRSCTNHALNIIDSSTTAKRGRRASGAEGRPSELVVMSENQLHRMTGDSEISFDAFVDSFADTTVDESFVSNISIARLIHRFKGRKRKALMILSGHEDTRFTAWLLKQNRIKEGEDQFDLQSRVSHKTFIELLSKYLGVIKKCFEDFVASVGQILRSHLEYA